MQTNRRPSQCQFEGGFFTVYMHERTTTFCNLFLIREGVKPIEVHLQIKVHMVLYACHSRKCLNGIRHSKMV
jgi:hypothetical protein